eukprot:1344613-Rhodomonas_salina.1
MPEREGRPEEEEDAAVDVVPKVTCTPHSWSRRCSETTHTCSTATRTPRKSCPRTSRPCAKLLQHITLAPKVVPTHHTRAK